MRTLIMLVCLGCLAGCGDDGPDAPPRLPQLVDNGGPRLGHVQVVPIYFADDPDAGVLTAFYRWIVTSSWLTTVGAEYGVGHGSVLATVQRTDAAPLEIDDAQIIDLLYQGLADGSLPQPTTDGGDVLYVVHFPLQTTVTAGSGTSCVDFGGYHASARRDGVELAYAVIPACSEFARGFLDVEGREYAASHELIEAATDPYPANQPGFQLRDRTSTWRALGEEVGDLCVRGDETGVHREAGFVATRSWSNAAAAAEQDPCLPAQGPATYFNVVTSSRTVLRIPPGSHQPVELVAWAQDTLPDWTVSVQAADDTQATLTLGVTQLGPGKSATLDFAVAASTAIGAPVRGYVVSAGTSTYQYLPLL
ncbi:MAG TPA: hypothetical protein VFT22_24065, partial [Kofleriaceae bacterium]|nr:hypothetical protein [Kofleriaceae bacterium]